MEDKVTIVALHDKPDLIEDCIKLLNDEWPRSKTARFKLYLSSFIINSVFKVNFLIFRMRSIENSNPNLPISLLLLKKYPKNQR